MSLQSIETKNLLDIIDKLRSHGINRYINLPEIVVCGEQSSGKSSVLEAVSGVKFPSKDSLCTRFATELILRRGQEVPIKISIVPGSQEKDRSDHDMKKIRDFHLSVSAETLQIEEVIESAKRAMGIDEGDRVFSSDILRLEMSGPNQPHLTLVDLPGLFQAGSRSQSDADSKVVESLVLSYMKNPRSIILAVVSAKSDFNNQSITRHSRQIDPKGERTLGLVTKPDTLDEGSDSERFYFELAQNKDVRFRLGWHVLRNRDYISRHTSDEERNMVEEVFFNTGIWRSLPANQVGVHTLKPRLSKILKDHIVAQLPDVLAQIKSGIRECTERLDTLGSSRATVQEQRRYLLQVSQSFSTLIRAAIDGQYSDPFFGDASTAEGYRRRLRAVLQNTLTDFAAEMRKKGHTYTIVDEGPIKLPRQISRSDYVGKVTKLLERSRGRELPGTFDPLIIGQLFHEQRKPWTAMVDKYLEKILRAVYILAHTALSHVCDESTRAGLSSRFVYVRLEKLIAELRKKVVELLKPHESGHPITYNHYLTENVQNAQSKRRAQEVKKSLERVLGGDCTAVSAAKIQVNVNALISTLVSKTEANMVTYASSIATDFMEAFYKVAMKKVIDDVSVLAVEARLIQELPSLFSPADIIDMDDAAVGSLASESEGASTERMICSEKLRILEDGLRALQSTREISSVPQDSDESLILEWKERTTMELVDDPCDRPIFALEEQPLVVLEESLLVENDLAYPDHTLAPVDSLDSPNSTKPKKKKKKAKTNGEYLSD